MLFWKPFYSFQIRKIRARMTEIITRDVSSGTVKELVEKLIPDSIADSILKRCRSIYPMQVCKSITQSNPYPNICPGSKALSTWSERSPRIS